MGPSWLASVAEPTWPSAAVLRRLEDRVPRAGDDVRELGRLETRPVGPEGLADTLAAANRRSRRLADLCSSATALRSWP